MRAPPRPALLSAGASALSLLACLLAGCDDGADAAPSDATPSDATHSDATTSDAATSDAAPRFDLGVQDATAPNGADANGGDGATPDLGAIPDAAPLPPLPVRAPLTAPPDPLAGGPVESCATYEASRCLDGRQQRCAVYDAHDATFVEPDPLLRRVLHAERRYERYHQPDGQTVQRVFTAPTPPGTPEAEWGDPARLHGYDGAGDAAIWTGVALDAYALRYATTGTEADYARMEAKARRLVALFDVTGVPGYLARHHWGQLAEDAPRVQAQAPDSIVDHRGVDHRDHVFDPTRLEAAPSVYREGVELDGQVVPVTPMWHGNPSIDQYTGPMISFPLVHGMLRDDALKERLARHLVCYVKRLERIEIRHVQSNPDVLTAVQSFLGGGRLQLDPGDIDPSAVDTAVGFALRQLNGRSAADFEMGCPEDLPWEADRVIDLEDPLYFAQALGLVSDLMSRDQERAGSLDHFYAPNIRGGDAIHLMHLATLGWWFTGEDRFRRFLFDELIGRLHTVEVAATAGALEVPDWCRAFYGGHITYPALWSLINLLPADEPAVRDLRDALRRAMHTEFEQRERGPLADLKFDLLYADVAPDDEADAAEAARDRARATLAVMGGNGGILDDPRRTYALPVERVLAEWPEGTMLRCPSAEERGACEDGVTLLGVHVAGDAITRPCNGGPAECVLDDGLCADALTDAPLPPALRGFTDFLWQRGPYDIGAGGNGGFEQSPGLDLIEPYWLARKTGVVTEGAGLVLAWEDVSACE